MGSKLAVMCSSTTSQAGVINVCCKCEAKTTRPFITHIKEQLKQTKDKLQKRIEIGDECCECTCTKSEDDITTIIIVNKSGGCVPKGGNGSKRSSNSENDTK
ncbi:hypothetical protein PGB90_008930 [Kerria lacca]